MCAKNPSYISTLIKWLKAVQPPVLCAYGFGSAFLQQKKKSEDIDLALLFKRPLGNIERWQLQADLASLLKKNIDLVDLSRASLVMKREVVASGILIYSATEADANAFSSYVLSAYCRFQEERKEIIDQALQRGSIYGR